jgi:hypothetical protein
MPFSTKQIWGTPSEIKKATFGARPVQSRRQPLGRALFNQEGNFWGVPCSIKKATFGAHPVQSRKQLWGAPHLIKKANLNNHSYQPALSSSSTL